MKVDLGSILKSLGLPIGLVAVFAAVLMFFGVSLEQVGTIAGTMFGAQALISLTIDVLKWAGVVKDGSAGKWSAALQLFGFASIALALGLYPSFDFPKLDAAFQVIAQFGVLVFGYIVQVVGGKQVHRAVVYGIGVRAFTLSRA